MNFFLKQGILARLNCGLAGFASIFLPGLLEASDCGEKPLSVNFYEQVSFYSLIIGFGLVFLAIIFDQKKIKGAFFGLAVFPFLAWGYIHFLVDFGELEKIQYNRQLQAENTLANIAEAQDRYKSEHDTYLKDLDKLKSHLYGAHGIDECVQILEIEVTWDHWSATARHVHGAEEVHWDSIMGSSLKRG
ncbi:MAG: hypothetical protein IIA62_03560 [Nitrospinae bacterium]|nr:hypothetical protein [Nitrospinota bacterium]